MKLIIDIPKEDYEFTKGAKTARVFPSEYYVKLILNGIPLDSVKFHIEHMTCKQYEHRLTLDRQEVIDVLDNFIGKEIEEKE